MKVTLNKHLKAALDKAGIRTEGDSGLENALNAAYNDGTAVTETKDKVSGTRINDKKGLFISREINGVVREGKVTDPLRFLNFSMGLDKFHAVYGEPDGELTVAILPVSLRLWAEAKFSMTKSAEAKPEAKADVKRRNGNVEAVTV